LTIAIVGFCVLVDVDNLLAIFSKNIITYGNCFIENKYTYGFHLICRNCFYRSVIVGPVKKLAYKYYPWTRKIRDNMVSIRKRVKGLNV